MEKYLVISALGSDRPGIVDALSKAVVDQNCNIIDSRMTVLGGEFAVIMLLKGAETAVASVETSIGEQAAGWGLTVQFRHTEARPLQQEAIPYAIEVVALDHPGIVHDIANFFSVKQINIDDMQTGTYSAAHTGTPMFSLSMVVQVPGKVRIANLREEFINFCDERNLDAVIEPCKR